MTGEDWGNDFGRAVMLFVNGEGIRERGQYGQRHVDDSFLLLLQRPRRADRVRHAAGTSTARSGSGSSTTAEPAPGRPAGRRGRRHDRGAGPLARRPGQDGLMTPPYRRPTGSRCAPASTSTATAELADYLADLGVSHLYTAPLLTATPGSDARLRRGRPPRGQPGARRRGGPAGAGRGAARGRARAWSSTSCPTTPGVAVPAANPAWWDVLRDGPRLARTRRWFDIDWDRGPAAAAGAGRRPGRPRRRCAIEDGELRYYDTGSRSPTAPATARPREVHDRQHYELVDWRRGDAELNYRRFFAITDLAGLRVEDPDGVRRHPRRDPALVRRGRRARHPGRPPGRAARPGRLPAAAARRPRRTPGSWWRRSSSRARSCRPGRSTAPPGTTRWPRSAASSSTRPPRPSFTTLDHRPDRRARRPGRS